MILPLVSVHVAPGTMTAALARVAALTSNVNLAFNPTIMSPGEWEGWDVARNGNININLYKNPELFAYVHPHIICIGTVLKCPSDDRHTTEPRPVQQLGEGEEISPPKPMWREAS